MQLDAGQLAEFYETALGQTARRLIARRLRVLWPEVRALRVLGYGFALPYLKAYLGEAERVVALMPAQMGVVAWPPGARPLSALGEECALPFAEAVFDRILVVHGLEGAEAARPLLRQLWRVMAPEGRLLVVAPNRTSLWAQLERSPFACGRPFRKSELAGLLRDTLFEPLRFGHALYMPPFKGRLSPLTANWEKLGRRLVPGMAGVHLIEARKSLYAPAIEPGRKAVAHGLVRA